MLGDQKLGSSCQEQPLCSGNLMMFMNHVQDPSCRDYSEIFSGVSSNYVESVGDRSNCEMEFIPPVVGGILADSNFQCQGVSLSLSTHSPSVVSMPSFPPQYQTSALASSFINTPPSIFEKRPNLKPCISDVKNGMYMVVGSGNSIYIEAAQQLLDEMVSVREALKELKSKKLKSSNGLGVDGCRENDGEANDLNGEICSNARELLITNSSGDLSPTERQDLKNKHSKLLSLLGEVSQQLVDVLASVLVFLFLSICLFVCGCFWCIFLHDALACCSNKKKSDIVEVAIVLPISCYVVSWVKFNGDEYIELIY